MIGSGVTKLVIAVRADVRAITGPARVISLVGALALYITGVPLRTGWTFFKFLFLVIIFLLKLLWDCFYSLHQVGGVHLRGDA